MARRTGWMLAVAAALTGAAAWAQDKAPDAVAMEKQPPTVEVLDAGSGEKTALRYAPKAGEAFEMSVAMDMSMSMSMGGQEMPPMDMPRVTTEASIAADEVGGGEIHYTVTFGAVRAEGGPMAAQMAEMLGALEGMTGKGVMTDRGESKSLELEVPPDLAPPVKQQVESMKGSIEGMSALLPEEPVGEGARWKVSQDLEQGGIKLAQTMEFTLLSLEGGVAKLAVRMTQEAGAQEIKNDQLPPGMTLELKSLAGSGEGAMTSDLTWLAPVEGNMAFTADAKMSAAQMGEMSQKMTMKTTMTGKRAE